MSQSQGSGSEPTWPYQPYPHQPDPQRAGQPYPNQPFSNQPYPNQPYQAYPDQAYPDQAYPGRTGQPYPQPGRQTGGHQAGYQPTPPPPGALQPYVYAQPRQPVQGYVYTAGYPVQQKSRLAAGLLGIFLGTLGIHNFYLGRTGIAVLQLLITLLSLGFLAVVVAIWALIEGIMILAGSPSFRTDARGIPLRD